MTTGVITVARRVSASSVDARARTEVARLSLDGRARAGTRARVARDAEARMVVTL